jgi:hypothetical protein
MSKKLLKIIGIISLVFAGIYLFLFVTIHLIVPYNYFDINFFDYIIILIMAVFSLLLAFGGIVFLHYSNLSDDMLKIKKEFILAWSIVFLFTSGICGILGLITYTLLYDNASVGEKNDYIDEIKKLEKLKRNGLITEEEFAKKKKKILDI